MNSGILDAHNLAYRIAEGLTPASLEEYTAERLHSVGKNLEIANVLFSKSMDIAKTLGLDIRYLNMFESLVSPFKSSPITQKLFKLGVKAGSLHLESDLIAQGLSDALRKKNIHIPLILLENEFQSKVELTANTTDSLGHIQQIKRTLLLLPCSKIHFYQKSKGLLEKRLISAREIGDSIQSSTFKIAIQRDYNLQSKSSIQKTQSTIHLLDCKADKLTEFLANWPIEKANFLLKDELLTIMPEIKPYLESNTDLYLRKDGYIEVLPVQNSV